VNLPGIIALKSLTKRDYRVLVAIETGMRNSEFVEIDLIAKFAAITVSETERTLKSLHKMNLVHRWTGHFIGYELTIHGYDSLALNALYERNAIKSIGREKGVGKESKVFFALDGNDNEVVIKMHRVGFTSFHQVRKKRRYTANKRHISELYSSRLSAETEYNWIKLANSLSLPVPQAYSWNRHIISIELIDGIDLQKINRITDPSSLLDDILNFIDEAWNRGRFVHGDLSEHNIILNYEEKGIIIDFPQAVSSDLPEAKELLKRDIYNILTYFRRKHGISLDENEIYKTITKAQ